jgi:hypothetical protein
MVVLLIFAALSTAVYFTLFKPNSEIIKAQDKNNENKSVETMNSPKKFNIVTNKTKVIIIYTYLIDGNTIEKEANGSNFINSIVGLKEEEVRKFYENMNYKLLSFSTDEIKVKASVINSWPPNSYVVKSNLDEVIIYTVDSQGQLTLPQKTGLYIDMLPPEDRDAVLKGKVYDKYEEVEELLDDYRS